MGKESNLMSMDDADPQLESLLHHALFRFDCPPLEQWLLFSWGQLPPALEGSLANHLAICPLCAEEVAEIRHASLQTSPKPSISGMTTTQDSPSRDFGDIQEMVGGLLTRFSSKMTLLIANLVQPLQPAMALGALRGQPTDSMLYEFEGGVISLQSQQDGEETSSLHGQIMTDTPESHFQNITLISQVVDDAPAIEGVDESGGFTINSLLRGEYQLRIQAANQIVVIPTINIT